jgi:hypothetical protein
MSESDGIDLLNVDDATLERLGKELLDQSAPMSKRMRAVFTLRNINGDRAVLAMKDGASKTCDFSRKNSKFSLRPLRNTFLFDESVFSYHLISIC